MTPQGEFEPAIDRLRRKQATKWRHVDDDVLPSWIAETDFEPCPAIVEAIQAFLDRGDLGYPDWWTDPEPLAGPFAQRMDHRYGWSPDPAEVRHVCDLIQAVQVVVALATGPGDPVAMHVPNYPPFLRALAAMGRPLVPCPWEEDGSSWSFDAQRLDDDVRRTGAKVLIVVNPHNPTGRVLRRDELESLAEVAARHDMVVVSDELHAELTHDDRHHVPFASLSDETVLRTVTVTSSTKSFNTGGLRVGVAHVGDPRVRAAWDAVPPEYFGSLNVLGVAATIAAWQDGDDWLERQRRHLTEQRDHLAARVAGMPGVSLRAPEATYLAWLDCRGAGLGDDPALHFRKEARVELVSGLDFGPGGEGYVRLNFATSRVILDEIIDRLQTSLPG